MSNFKGQKSDKFFLLPKKKKKKGHIQRIRERQHSKPNIKFQATANGWNGGTCMCLSGWVRVEVRTGTDLTHRCKFFFTCPNRARYPVKNLADLRSWARGQTRKTVPSNTSGYTSKLLLQKPLLCCWRSPLSGGWR